MMRRLALVTIVIYTCLFALTEILQASRELTRFLSFCAGILLACIASYLEDQEKV